MRVIGIDLSGSSNLIDACAAALGAWHWKDPALQPKWLLPGNPPLHPYDYCC